MKYISTRPVTFFNVKLSIENHQIYKIPLSYIVCLNLHFGKWSTNKTNQTKTTFLTMVSQVHLHAYFAIWSLHEVDLSYKIICNMCLTTDRKRKIVFSSFYNVVKFEKLPRHQNLNAKYRLIESHRLSVVKIMICFYLVWLSCLINLLEIESPPHAN